MNIGNRIPSYGVAIVLFVVLYVSACDSSFEPLEQNEEYAFSIYGTLDLHADTQWVRVMPIRETLVSTNPEPKEVKVTLTRERTGETVVLNDSLFVFGGNTYVRNYWTTVPLQPNEEFVLRAEASGGRSSSAAVTIPSPLPIPLVKYSENSQGASVTGSIAEPLVMLDTRFKVEVIKEVGPNPKVELIFSHLDDVYVDSEGDFSFSMRVANSIADRLGLRPEELIFLSRELELATGSEDWPDLSDLSEEEVVLTDVVTNVENGTGFVAGIARRRVPLESCYDEEGELISCEELE